MCFDEVFPYLSSCIVSSDIALLLTLILLIFSYSFLVVQAAERLMSILNLNVYCVVRTLLIATFILHTVTQ